MMEDSSSMRQILFVLYCWDILGYIIAYIMDYTAMWIVLYFVNIYQFYSTLEGSVKTTELVNVMKSRLLKKSNYSAKKLYKFALFVGKI